MPIISIIVPVYNVELYLRKCVDSILAQTFTDFECILVDDGSLDSCPAICDEYVERDSRIVVIHQKNSGSAVSRDVGLQMAQSEWIMFVDSDDWLEYNTLELLYEAQRETDAYIVIGNFFILYSWGTQKISYPQIESNENIIDWFFLKCHWKTLWGKLYKKTLFDGYIVPPFNILEDAIINVQIFSKLSSTRIQFIDSYIYNYNRKVTCSLLLQMENEKYYSYMEYPLIKAIIYIDNYVKKSSKNNYDASYAYFFINNGVIPYLERGNNITKNEIKYLLSMNYYGKCFYLLKFHRRAFIYSYKFSIHIGKAYSFIHRVMRAIIYKMRMANYLR